MSDPDLPLKSRLADAPALEEGFPSLADAHRHDRDISQRELSYLIDRRDKLTERIRFGLVTLNGASLLALLSALGGSGNAATWLGFTPHNAVYSAFAFALGLILSGWSVVTQQNLYIREAGDGVKRALTLAQLAARYRLPSTAKSVEELGEAMREAHNLPSVGFQYSSLAISAQNFAAGAWLFGIGLPLATALGVG